MKLYYYPKDLESRKVMVALSELGTICEKIYVDLTKGENKKEPVISLSPNGELPILQDEKEKFVLWEANSIMLYLSEKDQLKRLMAVEKKAKGEMFQWLFFEKSEVAPLFKKLYSLIKTFKEGEKEKVIMITDCKKKIEKIVELLNIHLEKRRWIADTFITSADISLCCYLSLCKDFGIDISLYTNVTSWLNRVQSRSSWKNTLPKEDDGGVTQEVNKEETNL